MSTRAHSPRFYIDCGDLRGRFKYSDKHWKPWSLLEEAFNEKISTLDFFVGLTLKDEQGRRWKPVLRAVLVPAEGGTGEHAV